nr:DUF2057 domain-containing protein [uncultured Desulfobulbus sp.]
MKLFMSFLVVAVFSAGSPAWASVSMEIPKTLSVLALNGKAAKFRDTITLKDGVNQLAVQVVKDVGKHMDADMEYSDVFVVKFTATDQSLKMTIPRIRSEQSVRQFNEEPNIVISSLSGEQLELAVDKLEKEGFQILRDYEAELAAFNRTNSPAAVPVHASQGFSREASSSMSYHTIPQPENEAMNPQNKQPNMADDMLKYWYIQADDATRDKFKKWINE